jgi:hypothetical protein
LSAVVAAANAAREQAVTSVAGLPDQVAHVLSGAFGQVSCPSPPSLLSTPNSPLASNSFQRCIFIGCTLSDALEEGSGGMSNAKLIDLTASCNNSRVYQLRQFLHFRAAPRHYFQFALSLKFPDSSSADADSVADAARMVPSRNHKTLTPLL